MLKTGLFGGAAALALLSAPGVAAAQDPAALEARIAQLEAQLTALKAEVAASRPAPAATAAPAADVIRLPTPGQTPAAAPAAPPSSSASSDGFRIGSHTIKYGGFIKADAVASRYDGGDPANGDALRDFYLPGSIPVGGADEGTALDFNARQTRFWLTTDGLIGGHKIGTRIELDFQVLPGTGDQRTTSPSTPALRRAFVTFDNWLFGQEWTNWQNIAVLPETADYLGPSEGTVFARQAQVRYTRGPLSIALENPETTVSPFGAGARIVADDNSLPDVTVRWQKAMGPGEFALSGIVRQLAYEVGGTPVDDSVVGWGLSGSGKIKVGANDDLRFMLTGGEGIGRYVGLNFANDAVLTAGGDLEAIGIVAGFAGYRHVWRPGLRSNLIYSFQRVDNDASLTGLLVNQAADSIRGNLIWSPVAGFDVGGELSFGRRELESGAEGDLTRVQLFAKYGF